MPSFGLIEKNMELSHTYLAVHKKYERSAENNSNSVFRILNMKL